MSDQARRDKRYPSKHELLVQCESWSEFAQLYATDISQGGMFIITDDPPPILSEIGVQLKLPEGHEISLRASVVHVIDSEQAARDKRDAGIGVQFVHLDAVRKQQIQQLVQFSRWEGASDNPMATYASRLFEMSASLPPSKVLDALPPEPAGVAEPEARPSVRARDANTARPRRKTGESVNTGVAEAAATATGSATAPPAPDGAVPASPPKPTDIKKLKLGMTHLAHKHFEEAIKTFEEMAKDNPGDKQALQWLHIASARLRIKRSDTPGAVEHYQKVLEFSEDNHEARKFVREHHTKQRLSALPFGRYFVKKT